MKIAIVGAGPVGMLLALMLVREGLDVTVFERRADRARGSRSIGVHPPSLEVLAELGLADRFLARGVHIGRGLAFGAAGPLGAIDFARCAGAYRFVLALPQDDTESILRDALEALAPSCVEIAEVDRVDEGATHVDVHLRTSAGVPERRRFSIVVGCDGKHSAVRRALSIDFVGKAYAGRYAMADFPDTTDLETSAGVFLGASGLVEAFPLPGKVRRWVARCGDLEESAAEAVAASVARRTGFTLDPRQATRPSFFRAERYLASRLARGRVALAGDAAHVVSPIGGQGMNLGWLGARSLARAIAGARDGDVVSALARDARRRARVARAAARRAELNMWLGRPLTDARARDAVLGALLRPPTDALLARIFTMRGLALGA